MNVFEMIEAQQKGKENTAPWMVGEQLKDICRREPLAAELVEKDLAIKEMSLAACEKKIKAYADAHKKGSCAVVPPNVAEGIIRKFYGIPEPDERRAADSRPYEEDGGRGIPHRAQAPLPYGQEDDAEIIDFTAFL